MVPEVEETVLDILSEALDEPVEGLRTQRVLALYEWDSITTLLTLSQLEARFGITLDLRSYHAARTVDDLVNLVSETNPEMTKERL
jgi:acyl carrier protein